MSELDTEALRVLADSATRGPWHSHRNLNSVPNLVDFTHAPAAFAVLHTDAEPPNIAADGAFIAAAREAVPALCDEVDRLRRENAVLRDGMSDEVIVHTILTTLAAEGLAPETVIHLGRVLHAALAPRVDAS